MSGQVIFKKVMMEGFGSYSKPAVFPFDRQGINIIRGTNGAGKTTSFSALVWALYRLNLKGVKNDQVATWKQYRDDEFRGTRVAVELSKENQDYLIVRHLNFQGLTHGLGGESRLMIFCKDSSVEKFKPEHLMGENLHKSDMQEEINFIIGVDADAFMHSVLFGQRMTRLIKADNEEKRELFEKLFAVEFVDEAREKAKTRRDELALESTKLDTTILQNNNRIELLAQQITQAEDNLKHFQEQKDERIKVIQDKQDVISEGLKTANTDLKKAQKLADKYDKAKIEKLKKAITDAEAALELAQTDLDEKEQARKELNTEITGAEKKLKKFQDDLEEVTTNCPTCNTPLKKEQVALAKKNINASIKTEEKIIKGFTDKVRTQAQPLLEAQELVDTHTITLNKAETELQDYENSVETYKTALDTTIPLINQKITSLNEQMTTLDTELQTEQDTKPPKDTIKELTAQKATAQKAIDDSNTKKDELINKSSKITWWIDKGFAAGGLKAFVFNAMLVQLNKSVEKYAARFGLIVRFSVDLTKKNKPFLTDCFKGNIKIEYNELSGGEQQRIDICLSFAMHDLIGYKANVNILMMDEVFEGLDEEGIETIFDLIRIKAGQGKAVYLITHSTFIDSLNAKHITISKDEHKNSYIH